MLDYYSAHQNSPRYVEALYYAGRVYSDIGDSRTALKYLHPAIDLVRRSDSNTPLRILILSQAAWRLSRIRLYDEAIPYLEEIISLENKEKDSVGLSNDLLMLGCIYMNEENLELAEKNFRMAKVYAMGRDEGQVSMADVSLSAIQHVKGNNREALGIIRSVLQKDTIPDPNFALSWAGRIYAECGLLDSAYMYADKLVHSDSPAHKRSGYEILLSDRMQGQIPSDSLLSYLYAYRDVLEDFYESNSAEMAVEQQANYNYNVHKRERENAESATERWKGYCYFFGFVAFVIGIVFLWKSNINQKEIIRLQKANADMDALLRNLQTEKSASKILSGSPMSQNNEELRSSLKSKIQQLREAGTNNMEIPASILNSASYKKVLEMLDDNRIINVDSIIWEDLEQDVLNQSPNFKNNLSLLVGRKVSRMELNIALLIKCGFTPMKIAAVIGKEKGTVSYYRLKWSKNIFGENIGNEKMDNIIRML
ncbi:MAG: hypothetical protein K2G52_12120 [Muribaculaceae bacterium]|nr:hypothetical protein [Muribaculaceae bacterium]